MRAINYNSIGEYEPVTEYGIRQQLITLCNKISQIVASCELNTIASCLLNQFGNKILPDPFEDSFDNSILSKEQSANRLPFLMAARVACWGILHYTYLNPKVMNVTSTKFLSSLTTEIKSGVIPTPKSIEGVLRASFLAITDEEQEIARSVFKDLMATQPFFQNPTHPEKTTLVCKQNVGVSVRKS